MPDSIVDQQLQNQQDQESAGSCFDRVRLRALRCVGEESSSLMRETMKRAKVFSCFLLLVSLGTLGGGCATLPNVSEVMEEVPTP